MLLAKKVRDQLKDENHRRRAMRLEMMRHEIKLRGTIQGVPKSLEPDETAPQS